MNTINHIKASFDGNLWVFDDARFGLRAEPFVPNATRAIDRALDRKYPDQPRPTKCLILFSITPLPEADLVAEREGDGTDAETQGSYYVDRSTPPHNDDRLWLCPAMCHYFGPVAPPKIWATIDR